MNEIPVKYERHIFVCVNERSEGECCSKRGGTEIAKAFKDHIDKNALSERFSITKTKCFGHCSEGPVVAIYPDGKIFKNVSMADVKEIIEDYL